MDEIIIDEILTGNDNATPGKPIDWACLDFGGDTRTETEKFMEKFPKFDDAFYEELARQEEEARLKAKKDFVLKHGLLIEQGTFLISFKD